ELPVVLKIEAVNTVARQPRREFRIEIRLTDRTEEEARKRISGVRYRLAVRLQSGRHAVEIEGSAGPVRDCGVEPEVKQLVSHFEGVLAPNFREVVAEGQCFIDAAAVAIPGEP